MKIKRFAAIFLCLLIVMPWGVIGSVSAVFVPIVDINCTESPTGTHVLDGNDCIYCSYHIYHTWEYKLVDDHIEAVCIGQGDCYSNYDGGKIYLSAPSDTYYNGSPVEAVVDDQLATGEEYELTYYDYQLEEESQNAPRDVGEYRATLALPGASISVEFSILAPFEIIAHPNSITEVFGNEVVLNVGVNVFDDIPVQYQWYVDSQPAVGATEPTFKIYPTVGAHDINCEVSCGGYTIKSNDATIIVDRNTLSTSQYSVNLSQKEFVYSSEAIEPEVIVTSNLYDLVAGVDYIVSYRNNINAGTGFADVEFQGNYSGSYSVPFLIKRAPLTVIAEDAQMVLGGEEPELTCTIIGLKGTDTAIVELSRTAAAVVGNYEIFGRVDAGNNYDVSFTKGVFKIIPDLSVLEGITEENVTIDSLHKLDQLKSDVEFANINARGEWQYVADACDKLIGIINNVSNEITSIINTVDRFEYATNLEKSTVENVFNRIDVMLSGQNLSETQRVTMEVYRQKSEFWLDDTVKIGDVNLNNKIDSRDYLLLKRAYFGTTTLEEDAKKAADVNENGKVDSRDYMLLKRAYFGTYAIRENRPLSFSPSFDLDIGYADGCVVTVLDFRSELMADLLNNSLWISEDVKKTPSDCCLNFDGRKIYYSTVSGMFLDKDNQRYILLSEEDKERVFEELEAARHGIIRNSIG